MFTVKFLGGARKSFSTEQLEIDESNITISDLLKLLLSLKPVNTVELDVNNILIAVNGIDSSAIYGKMTMIKNNDVVSIIPVIHGGSSKRVTFSISKKTIQIMQVGSQNSGIPFLDNIRKDFPTLTIQAVSSNFILNAYHAKKILALSLNSQKNNVLLSNKLETDILMRFALTPQISNAIALVGIKPNNNFILIAIGEKRCLELLYSKLLPYSISLFSKNNTVFLKKQFKINKNHLKSTFSKNPLEDLLVEKAAILF